MLAGIGSVPATLLSRPKGVRVSTLGWIAVGATVGGGLVGGVAAGLLTEDSGTGLRPDTVRASDDKKRRQLAEAKWHVIIGAGIGAGSGAMAGVRGVGLLLPTAVGAALFGALALSKAPDER
jgi:hypothetical protein